MFRRSISAMMADILCIERMCYLAVPNCRAIFLSSPTIHKKLVTPRERRLSSSLGTHRAKSDFLHQWNFLSVSLVFSLFHRRVWSNLVITAEQRDAQTCKLCLRIFRVASPCWKCLLAHSHFKNILWCYCKCVFKQIVSTWKVYRHGQVDISSSVKVPIIALILTDNQTVKHCLHVCS